MPKDIPNEIRALLDDGELQRVDFKGPMSFRGVSAAKLTKHIVGMANTRGGGVLIIGVREEPDKSLTPVGLEERQAATFDVSIVNAGVEKYAAPSPRVRVTTRIEGGKRFVVIRVPEFSDMPLVITKPYSERKSKGGTDGGFEEKPIFSAGDVLIRTTQVSTRRVNTEAEMRELLDLAIKKRLAQSALPDPQPDWSAEEDCALWRNVKIPDGGYWDVVMRPADRKHLGHTHAGLKRLVSDSQVSIYGRDFPLTGPALHPLKNASCEHDGTIYIHHNSNWLGVLERWKLFATGYFRHVRHYQEDRFPIEDRKTLLWRISLAVLGEYFLFGARLYSGFGISGAVEYKVRLTDTLDRVLVSDEYISESLIGHPRRCAAPEIVFGGSFNPIETRADPVPIAVEAARRLFALFQWDAPNEDMLRSELEDVVKGQS